MLHSPDTDAFPPAAPHAVPAYSRSRWLSGLARWWHAVFTRNAYARGPDSVRSGRKSHRFFQHLIETEDGSATSAPARGDDEGR